MKNHDTQFSAQPRYQSAPDIYLESARRLGASPQLCVAIEDSDAGALAASAAGMITLIVPDLKAPSAQARSVAFSVLASLLEARNQIVSLMRDARENDFEKQ